MRKYILLFFLLIWYKELFRVINNNQDWNSKGETIPNSECCLLTAEEEWHSYPGVLISYMSRAFSTLCCSRVKSEPAILLPLLVEKNIHDFCHVAAFELFSRTQSGWRVSPLWGFSCVTAWSLSMKYFFLQHAQLKGLSPKLNLTWQAKSCITNWATKRFLFAWIFECRVRLEWTIFFFFFTKRSNLPICS